MSAAVRPLVLATWSAIAIAAASSGLPEAAGSKDETVLPTVHEKVSSMEAHRGLLTLHIDRQTGKVWLEVPPNEDGPLEVLYVEGLTTGLGSNPVGLDRGQLGVARLVRFRSLGNRLLLEVPNLSYRAQSQEQAELLAVEQSFARSVLWGGEIAARDPGGRCLVDFTSFLVRDAHGSARNLEQAEQGTFSLDAERSAVDFDSLLAFPDNVEIEALLTLSSDKPGPLVRQTAPDPRSVSLVQHHSFIRLPPPGYGPRRHDPRAGSFPIRFLDYAAPLDAPLEQRWIVRHRLEKTDPAAASSPAREPIVYYVDPGVPEPIRSALVEGASWWARAFEEAGFVDAFRVELLPPDAHPLDVRYNVIQWVHRSTRGWSYGGGVVDPRTGEMIKGHVSLGSLRIRQDILLFEGLAGVAKTGSGEPDDPIELALARIRQLSAHEVGHTLGLNHNFAASTYGGRASVMDYPAPLIDIGDDGSLDFRDAYGVGVGDWDVQTIRYAYSQFPPGADEAAMLDGIVADGLERGLVYLSDADARPAGAAHPLANLWDNGDDPATELEHLLNVRRIALSRFGEGNLAAGRPLALLEELLAPLYLHHRYQVTAAAKLIGGVDYRYALRGDGQPSAEPVDATWQRHALESLLAAMAPVALDLPEPLLATLLPRPDEYSPHPELFSGRTAPLFDPLAAAATAADLVVEALLVPERLARVLDQHRRDPALPGVGELLERLVGATFPAAPAASPRLAELERTVQAVVADRLVRLAADDATAPGIRAAAEARLAGLRKQLEIPALDEEGAHRALLARQLRRFLDERQWTPLEIAPSPAAPPGMPIGMASGCNLDHPDRPVEPGRVR